MAEAAARARDAVDLPGLVGFTVSALSPVASVFVSGAGVLRIAGTGTLAGMVLGAGIAVLAAVLYAEVASRVPHAGGIYAGVRAALGAPAGFVVMGLALLTAPAFVAFSAQGFAAALAAAVPGMPAGAAAVGVVLLAALLAVLRLRTNIAVTGAMLACELVALGVLVVVGLGESARSVPQALFHPVRAAGTGTWVPVDAARLVIATVGGAFACSGALWGTYLGEDAAGTPAAFGRGLAASGLIGAGLVAVPLGIAALAVTGGDLADPEGPLIALIRRGAGARLTALTGLAIGVAILNNLLAMTIALARLVAATGRERLWPVRIATLLRRRAGTGAPVAATLLLAAAALPMLLVPNQRLLVILSAEVVTPLLIAGTVLVGRRRAPIGEGRYLSPLYPALPVLGLLIGAAVLAAEWQDAAVGRPGLEVLAVATTGLALLYLALRTR